VVTGGEIRADANGSLYKRSRIKILNPHRKCPDITNRSAQRNDNHTHIDIKKVEIDRGWEATEKTNTAKQEKEFIRASLLVHKLSELCSVAFMIYM
jgi:hypothetical protein